MKLTELHNRFTNETITFDEFKKYCVGIKAIMEKYSNNELLIEDVYDDDTFKLLLIATQDALKSIHINSMDSWFSMMDLAIEKEEFEIAADVKFITETHEILLISFIYKFRKELYTNEFLEDILNVNALNNFFITHK